MFYVLQLEKNTTIKGRINKFLLMPKFEVDDNKEYELKAIQNSTIYAKEADRYLSKLYYLVSWKSYPKEKNT